jgi:tetratricopeptide (TPR) repeat protein
MAYRGLAAAHGNIGQWKERDKQLQLALDSVDKVSAKERYSIQGEYSRRKEVTYAKAIEAYNELLKLVPNDHLGRYYLGWLNTNLEHFDKAAKHFEVLREQEFRFAPAYNFLATIHFTQDRIDEGLQVLDAYVSQHPSNMDAHVSRGVYLLQTERFDEADTALKKAASLAPDHAAPNFQQSRRLLLMEEWSESAKMAEKAAQGEEPGWRLAGGNLLALGNLYSGKSEAALRNVTRAVEGYKGEPSTTAASKNFAGEILLESGKAKEALPWLKEARVAGKDHVPEWEAIYLAAKAQAVLGNWDQAEKLAGELEGIAKMLPTEKEKRRYHHLRGEFALLKGDAKSAVAELEKAESLLPPRGSISGRVPSHVPIWFALGRAYLEGGQDTESLRWFEKVTESTAERLRWPIDYVRSFYFCGKIHEKQGRRDKALELYRRFHELWKDGDMDRERVEEVASKLRPT